MRLSQRPTWRSWPTSRKLEYALKLGPPPQTPLPATASALAPTTSAAPPTDEVVPAVALRLFRDLMCRCGEPNCAHEPLEACPCKFAGKERERIIAEVRRLGDGSPKRDEATYATITREYLAKHPLTESSDGPSWLKLSGIAVLILAGAAGIFWLAERYRGRQREAPEPRRFVSQGKKKEGQGSALTVTPARSPA